MSESIVVIPCYNEAKRLSIRSFKAFARKGYPQKLLFVNDGSTDQTRSLLENLKADDPQRFLVYNLPRNVGKAEAVRHGILVGLASNPDYIGYWDADLATPLDVIPVFSDVLDARPDIDMVFGARVKLLGRKIERQALRHYAGRVFATAASLTLKLPIYDTQCGAKLLRVSPTMVSLFEKPFMTKWLLDVELLARLIQARRGTTQPQAADIIYEIPLEEWRDQSGSKVSAIDFPKAIWALARLYWKYLR